eukprot:TRINITY_DN1337_c0_g1_i3.p1 TRINITY_DN1337_c0_g1~~TRINITY_DN1337_c0_g1_i3.p1  ORF type:complete len:318 (-),score=49.70 TRINITY_DN1337_c0_g1_i3:38-991(-)
MRGKSTIKPLISRSGINIGQIMRTSYILGLDKFFYYDPQSFWKDEETAANIKRFSRGACNAPTIEEVKDVKSFLQNYKGRKIATALSRNSVPAYSFEFKEGDLILFGNEIHGIPTDIVDMTDHQIIIPMRRFHRDNRTPTSASPCYSVSHAFAMVGYAIVSQFCQRHISDNEGWRYGDWVNTSTLPTPVPTSTPSSSTPSEARLTKPDLTSHRASSPETTPSFNMAMPIKPAPSSSPSNQGPASPSSRYLPPPNGFIPSDPSSNLISNTPMSISRHIPQDLTPNTPPSSKKLPHGDDFTMIAKRSRVDATIQSLPSE